MKKLLLLTLLITIYTGVTFAQTGDENGIVITFQIFKQTPDNFIFIPGALVDMEVNYNDSTLVPVYSESFLLTTDALSNVSCKVGHGSNPNPFLLTPDMLRNIHSFSWSGTIDNGTDIIDISGSDKFRPVAKAQFANYAENSLNFSGNKFSKYPGSFEDFVNPPANVTTSLLFQLADTTAGDLSLWPMRMKNNVVVEDVVYSVTDLLDEMLRIRTPLDRSLGISDVPFNKTDSKINVCSGGLQGRFFNVLGVTAKPGSSPSSIHNTAAIYANNEAPDGSAGINAKAGTWGVFATANNGVVGVSSGGGNGAGTWGGLSQAPDAGGYKYSVLGNSGGFAGSWAGAYFGSGFYTGTWAVSSDARLKTEIRAQSNALDQVMKLRPANYNYRQDTPYHLPEGLHHGFIAQEVEEILPELVSDIIMPNSLDPQNMHTSGTSQYKAINYIEIISILTQAMKELNTTMQAKFEAQEAENAELRRLIKEK